MLRIMDVTMFIRLAAVVLMALLYNIVALDRPVTAAPLSVLPLWTLGSNDTQPCRLEDINPSHVILHGSLHRTYSIQVNTSPSYHARIDIPTRRVSNEPFSVYVERLGNLTHCKNKYVDVYRNPGVCVGTKNTEYYLHNQETWTRLKYCFKLFLYWFWEQTIKLWKLLS